jgi:hypothetical protein
VILYVLPQLLGASGKLVGWAVKGKRSRLQEKQLAHAGENWVPAESESNGSLDAAAATTAPRALHSNIAAHTKAPHPAPAHSAGARNGVSTSRNIPSGGEETQSVSISQHGANSSNSLSSGTTGGRGKVLEIGSKAPDDLEEISSSASNGADTASASNGAAGGGASSNSGAGAVGGVNNGAAVGASSNSTGSNGAGRRVRTAASDHAGSSHQTSTRQRMDSSTAARSSADDERRQASARASTSSSLSASKSDAQEQQEETPAWLLAQTGGSPTQGNPFAPGGLDNEEEPNFFSKIIDAGSALLSGKASSGQSNEVQPGAHTQHDGPGSRAPHHHGSHATGGHHEDSSSASEEEHDLERLPELSWANVRVMEDPRGSVVVRQALDALGQVSPRQEASMVAAVANADPVVSKLYGWYGQRDVFRFVAYTRAHAGLTRLG